MSLLVPLLNDADRAVRCARTLMRQIRVPKLDIVFLDAGSTDLTRQLLLQATADDPRVRLLIGSPTPPRWCAYAHACEQLAIAARGKVFVFLDPGLALAPGAVAAAVATLRANAYDLVLAEARRRVAGTAADSACAEPECDDVRGAAFQREGGFPSASGPTAASLMHGRLLAVDAEAYWRVGGHKAAAHDAHGEFGLVRAMRRSGGRVTSADGRHAIEYLDGSAWPRERSTVTGVASGVAGAGIAAAMTASAAATAAASVASGARLIGSDTENSILSSFTDTARRLLSALSLLPPTSSAPATRPAPSRPGIARTIRANHGYAAARLVSDAIAPSAFAPDPFATQPHDPFLLDD